MNQSAILTSLTNLITDATTSPSIRIQAYQQYMSQAHTAEARTVHIPSPMQVNSFDDTRLNNIPDYSILSAFQRHYMTQGAVSPTYNEHDRSPDSIPSHVKWNYTAKDSDTIPLHHLLEAGGVIYGSRGLHIEDEYSDYDFAFSYEEHKRVFDILVASHIAISNPTGYFQSSPEAGYKAFFQYKGLDPVSNERVKVDILFVHNDEDLDVIRSSVQDLQSIPQYMLRDKKFRIDAYNKALQDRGWKLTNDIRNNRRDPRPPVVRRERDSRGESLTRGITPWS